MHPHVARAALASLASTGDRVLDPFCGSGTTLVEAMAAGCRGIGADLHPLAVRLTRVKCSLWDGDSLDALEEAGQAVGALAEDRARTKARATKPTDETRPKHPMEDKWFAPHVRYEIANLQEGIAETEDGRIRDALELVLSSILVKVSNFESDSSQRLITQQIPRRFTSNLFARRTGELCRQLASFAEAVPAGVRSPRVVETDARRLRGIGDAVADWIITSPPYLGTYDYSAHQMLRVALLNLDDSRARRAEMGSRRDGEDDARRARADWERDMRESLRSMARVLDDGGSAIVMVGTSSVAGGRVHTDRLIEELADSVGLSFVAMASQDRPDFTPANAPKRKPLPEHLIWLRRQKRSADAPRGSAAQRHNEPGVDRRRSYPRQGGPERGRSERRGPDRGGPGRGGSDRGGSDRGGPDRGGPDRGGTGRGRR